MMNKAKPNANLLRVMKEPERVAKRGKPPKGLLSSTMPAKLEQAGKETTVEQKGFRTESLTKIFVVDRH
jgi:hypothetical protein